MALVIRHYIFGTSSRGTSICQAPSAQVRHLATHIRSSRGGQRILSHSRRLIGNACLQS